MVADATPEGREIRAQFDYSQPLFEDAASLSLGVMQRFEPGHDADADAETLLLGRFSTKLN